ncbi:Hypothetical predicted protein [Cloeon dipterum]|uniref:Transmembrane protein n=1 Tax=Cloeon dipterum TaxID=197152 RepID=A0A8S1C261_9INSE|nr:Hypothetical predicted protein [Cloeon dipterum]
MGLLDRRLLFSCLVVGIFAINFLQGTEANGGDWYNNNYNHKNKYKHYYHTRGYNGGYYNNSSSGKIPWSWSTFLQLLVFVFGVLILSFIFYCYCCYSPPVPEEEQQAARVANFLKHQEEQRNSDLPTIVHPPVTNRADNEPPSAPAMTPPLYPGWGTSDSPSFPPPDFTTATAPLIPPGIKPVDSSTYPPPGAPTLSSSTSQTTPPQIGFIIPPQDPANASVHFGGRVRAE